MQLFAQAADSASLTLKEKLSPHRPGWAIPSRGHRGLLIAVRPGPSLPSWHPLLLWEMEPDAQ